MTNCRDGTSGLLIGCLGAFLLLSSPSDVASFMPSNRIQKPVTTQSNSIFQNGPLNDKTHVFEINDQSPTTRRFDSRLHMANDDEGGTGVGIIAGLLLLIFVAGSVIPLAGTFGMKGQMSIADSVVTKQDAPGKLQGYESKQFSMSRSAIQEKLNSVPVFYVATAGSDGSTTMGTDIYMSYEEAVSASSGNPSASVKGTTLDQVM